MFGVFSLAVSPGTLPGGACVPGGPCPGFSLLLFSHDPDVAFSIMHQNVSHVLLAQRASPQFENRVQIFTFHLPMINLQDQVTLTNWPASKKNVVFNDFDFQIVLPRRRGANFGDFNFQKCSKAVSF